MVGETFQKTKDWLKPGPKAWKRYVILAVAVFVAWYVLHDTSGDDAKNGKNKNATVPVGIATATTGDIHVYLNGLGTVTPLKTVTVHSRVDGELINVAYQEGQLVKKDDLLAELDPRPYQAQLEQAQGQLARDEALLKEAQIDLERYQKLFKEDSIAQQQVDLQASLVKQYEGTVENDVGLVDNAKVQLVYTRITSPVDGRVGLRLVDSGNIVHAADTTGIVVVTQLQPITVIYSIPEDSIPTVMQHLQKGDALPVEAWDRSGKTKLAVGKLLAVDNEVNTTTGTLNLKAQFPNEENTLFANQFVNVKMLLDTKQGVTLLPSACIQRGTQGTFVYLVNPDKTVTLKVVTLGPSEGDNVEIGDGMKAGDQAVIDGADSLRDKAKIEIAAIDGKPVASDSDKGGDKSSADASASGDEHKHHHHKHSDDAKDEGAADAKDKHEDASTDQKPADAKDKPAETSKDSPPADSKPQPAADAKDNPPETAKDPQPADSKDNTAEAVKALDSAAASGPATTDNNANPQTSKDQPTADAKDKSSGDSKASP